jgi:hypothetical protein
MCLGWIASGVGRDLRGSRRVLLLTFGCLTYERPRGELATIDGYEWVLGSSLRFDVRPFDPDAPQRVVCGDKLLAPD